MQPDGQFLPEDTQPIRAHPRRISRWIWLLFGVIACGMFVATAIVMELLLTLANNTPVTLIIGEAEYHVTTGAPTVGMMLTEMGVALNDGDEISPPLTTHITPDMVIQVTEGRDVALTIDGRTTFVRTSKVMLNEILDDAGVSLSADDRIIIDGTQVQIADLNGWTLPVHHVDIRRAVTVTIRDGEGVSTAQTTELTVGEVLFAAGVTLYLSDGSVPDLNTPVSDGLEITVERAVPVTIIADNMTLNTRTHGTVVADALTQAGIILTGLDYIIPSEDSPLEAGMAVRVIRVNEEIITQQESLPFETVYQADGTLELDHQQLTQAGQTGLRQITTRVRYENGVEVSRRVEEDAIVSQPVNAVLSYGTNIVVHTLDTPDGTIEYWRVLRLYATSYHPAALGGDDVTATGRHLEHGVAGVDTSLIPFDTQLYVPGYGVALAADTGPDRSSPFWIDLGYSDADWVSWSHYVEVYFLLPVPTNVVYVLPEWRPLRGTSP
jgi:resuscitation-promoting factor RpfB